MDERTKAVISSSIALFINIAALFGASLDLGVIQNSVLTIVTAVTTLYAAWKNHNFTPEAQQAQHFLDELKGK